MSAQPLGTDDLCVLVAEDDKNLREQLASALADAGYTVDSAGDGEEGQFLGETEPY